MELNSIAFIPDGNRRFAVKAGVDFLKAYQAGTRKAWDVLHWLNSYPSIKVGTFYTLSLENFLNRKTERNILFKIFERELEKVKSSGLFEKNQTRLKFIGRTDLFSKTLKEKIREAEEFTQDFSNKTINLAFGYSGQAEIVDATKKIAQAFKEGELSLESIDTNSFSNYLYSDFDFPDLIIRTGKTQRLSGFLTYQSAYSELYFLDKFWPEFSEQDLAQAVEYYNSAQRNFGK